VVFDEEKLDGKTAETIHFVPK